MAVMIEQRQRVIEKRQRVIEQLKQKEEIERFTAIQKKEKREELNQLEKELNQLEKELNQQEKELKQLEKELKQLEKELKQLEKELNQLETTEQLKQAILKKQKREQLKQEELKQLETTEQLKQAILKKQKREQLKQAILKTQKREELKQLEKELKQLEKQLKQAILKKQKREQLKQEQLKQAILKTQKREELKQLEKQLKQAKEKRQRVVEQIKQKEEIERFTAIQKKEKREELKQLEKLERFTAIQIKGKREQLNQLEGCSSVLLKQDQSSLLNTIDGDASRIFNHLKTRHNVALKTSCSELPHDRQKLVRDNFFKIFNEKKDPKVTTKEKRRVITYKTVDDLWHTFEELGIDIGDVETSYISEFQVKAKEISEDDAVTAYLKQAARKILKSNSNQIHSIIPYHHLEQTAVVIYTYYPTQALFKQDWSKEFLGFPVFVVNLMFGYATEPPFLPKSYGTISSKQELLNEEKENVAQQLEKKHSNLSTICMDYRIKGNQLVQSELCLQIGVLTKGIIPLGEERICRKIEGVPVDVVESSATLCVQPMLKRVSPVNIGVGIGVEGDDTCTGSLGAVVKHNETGKLFILSNAHVLCRKGVLSSSSSIVQPSKQDYEEIKSQKNTSIEEHKKKYDRQRNRINENTIGTQIAVYFIHFLCQVGLNPLFKKLGLFPEHVQRLGEGLTKTENDVKFVKKDYNEIIIEQPRRIGTFSEPYIQQCSYDSGDGRHYGIDAAIALITPDEFEPEDMTEMYEWPIDLKNEDGRNIDKISLNGRFKTANEIREAIVSETIVYKCGRTSRVTRGKLSHEIVVKVGGSECTFEGVEEDCPAVSRRGALRLARDVTDNQMWRHVLMIKSATVETAGRRDFSAAGDSGAVVFDEEGSCVGLLFGRVDSQVLPRGGGLATPIHAVFQALNISLATKEDLKSYKERIKSNSWMTSFKFLGILLLLILLMVLFWIFLPPRNFLASLSFFSGKNTDDEL